MDCTKTMCDRLIKKMEHFTTENDIKSIHIHRETTCASLGFTHRYGPTEHQGPYVGTMRRKEHGVEEASPLDLMIDNGMMNEETFHAVSGERCIELSGAPAELEGAIRDKFTARGLNLEAGSCASASFNSLSHEAPAQSGVTLTTWMI